MQATMMMTQYLVATGTNILDESNSGGRSNETNIFELLDSISFQFYYILSIVSDVTCLN